MEFFNSVIVEIMDICVPLKTKTIHSNDKLWLTQDFKALLSNRHAAKSTGNQELYNKLRNSINMEYKALE